MKKHLLSLFALATMLFATSCSEDENIAESNQQNATFKIELEDAGNGSRALADGTVLGTGSKVNKVYYAVYETGKDQLLRAGSAAMTRNNEETVGSVVIPLVNGLKFDIAFFALHEKEDAEDVHESAFEVPTSGDLTQLRFKQSLLANQESYDAFSKVLSEYRTNTNSTTPVTLKRVVSQLNVGTTQEDLENVRKLNALPVKSKIVLKEVPTMFNARTGVADNLQNVTFDVSDILMATTPDQYGYSNEKLTNVMINETPTDFYYLAMAYVLANNQSGLFDADFEFYREDGDCVSQRSIPNLPLQRNYRTNITGNILTQKENFSITLDAEFGADPEHNVDANEITVASEDELNEILAAKAKANDKELILNVMGLASITDLNIQIPDDAKVSSITLNLLDLSSIVNVNSLIVSGDDYNKPVIIAIPDGTTVTTTTLNLPNAHVVLMDGTHTTVYSSTSSTTLEVAGGTTISTLIVNKGNVLIKSEGEVSNINRGEDNDGKIEVEVEPGAELTTVDADITVKTTLGDTNEWVLTKNVALLAPINVAQDDTLTIDLNGYTISQEMNQTTAYSMIVNNGTLTIKDSKGYGKISYKDNGQGGGYVSNTIQNSGTLTIESGIFENNSNETVATNGYPHPIDNSGILTINGGTFTNNANYSSMRIWCTEDDNTIVTINGGTFNGSIDFQTPNKKPNKGTLIINGGTFNADTYTKTAVRLLGFGTDVDEMNGYIKGGYFNGKIQLNKFIDGEFNSNVFVITGGTFTAEAKNNTSETLLGDKYAFVANEDGTYDVKQGNYLTLGEFVEAVINADGNYDGQDALVKIFVKGGDARKENIEGLPNRLQKYDNPDVYYAQYQRFAELTDVNISNVKFEFVPAEVTVTDAWYTNGATAEVDKINGELQFMNKGKVTLTNCTFNKVSVSPIYATELEITRCAFNDLQAYAIKDIKASSVISNNTFTNCNGGFWFADAPASITVNNNTFVQVGRRGAIQFSATGDYAKSSIEIKGNKVEGDGAFLRQLNESISDEQLTPIINGNSYENLYVEGSIQPVAKIGNVEYRTLELAVEAAQANDVITLNCDVTLTKELELPAGITFNGNGKQIDGSIYAGGNLTFVGHTKVTGFSASYYNRIITIGEGACLEVTGNGRVTLGYGNTFNITGSIEDAKTADKASIQPSLIIPGGISITGGNDAALNVTNAYVQIGDTTSKPGAANGKFTLNFDNSIVEFTKEFGFYEPTGGMNPTFEMNIKSSVFTTGAKLCVAAANSTVVVDNSVVTLTTYLRNSGVINLKNSSTLTGSTIQFGENGGNNGVITVDASSLDIKATSTGHAFDGKGTGSITLTNGAVANVDYYKAMTITYDKTSKFTGTEVQ